MINTPIRRYRRVNGVERYDVLDTAAAYRGTIDLRFGTDAGRFQKAMNLLLNNRPRYRVSRALPLRARPTRRALTEEECRTTSERLSVSENLKKLFVYFS